MQLLTVNPQKEVLNVIETKDDNMLKIPNVSSLLTIIVVLISGIYYRQSDFERFS